ncbi:MAG: FAD-dependent oxidoreductase [Nitrososphaerota archaeon]|nr:FAD-dependent oxidoreductase [Nitrososphaerota archaeon]
MKVVVIGGGIAGVAAATTAARRGSSVTILEGTGRLGLNRSLLPYVLSGGFPPEKVQVTEPNALSREFGVDVRLNDRALDVSSLSRSVRTENGRLDYDSLVLATGCQYLSDGPKGLSKQGVHLLRSPEDYLALSGSVAALSRPAVVGPAPLSLVVAQALSSSQRVRVFLGPRSLHRFSPGVGRMLVRAASAKDVELIDADADAVVGTRGAEAVLSSGRVYPCSGVVVLPKSCPSVPPSGCATGTYGGVLVDRWMRTSSKDIFAAGDCTETRMGSISLPSRLHSSSRVMGEVAGSNASGAAVRANLARSMALRIFGLEVCAAGVDIEEAARAGIDAVRVESECAARGDPSDGASVYASIVYDRPTRKVHGIQVAGPGALSLSEFCALAVASEMSLDQLAYHESPYLPSFNTDQSPIALTAGRALARVQERRVEAQGTHLRYR